MPTLIFSDSHLTDQFDSTWFNSIAPLIKKASRVVINGDFWDGEKISFDKFIHSQYSQYLFPLLRDKTHYIFGNHDPQFIQDGRVNLFSKRQANQVQLKLSAKKLTIRHGHLVAPGYDGCCGLSKLTLKSELTKSLYRRLDELGQGTNLLALIYQRLIARKEKKLLKRMRSYSQKHYQTDNIFVFGHRHAPKHNFENNFVVLGSYRFHHQRYLWLENDRIITVNQTY